jgi:hypothetical protein
MKPSNTLWGRVLAGCLAVSSTLGLWAGSAAAQTSDGWFDDSAQAPAPPAADEGSAPDAPSQPADSPPPPDFQTPPPAAAPAAPEDADAPENDAEAQTRAVQEFSPRLEPYGRWVDDPFYGRVWVPSRSVVGSEFVPYSTAGHWELTPDDTWLWASDYPFGWITFHYGRWVWASGGLWAWVPGYVYAPAWVDFRVGAGGYVGWAPLGPRYVWRNGVFLSLGYYRPAPFVYCPTQYVFVRTMPRYVIRDHYRVREISAHTHVVRPRYLSRGGVSYVSRGPSVREARIPARALPARRVVAQPRLAFSRQQPTRLESSRYSRDRSYPASPGYLSPHRELYQRAPATRPQAYGRYRSPALPQRSNPALRPPAPSPSNPAWRDRGGERWHGRGGDRTFTPPAAAPHMQRSTPAPAARGGYRPLPYSSGFDRGRVAPRAVAPRAVAPAARSAPERRGQRKDSNNSGDSHVRGRVPQRYGSGR